MINPANTATNPSSSTLASTSSQEDALDFALAIAHAADDRKGADIQVFKVGEVSVLADYFVIVTGFSNVQVRAIARTIEDTIEDNWHRRPLRTEGQTEGGWILQDYGEVIVHIFLPEERSFYNLEAFWGHATQIDFTPIQPNVPS